MNKSDYVWARGRLPTTYYWAIYNYGDKLLIGASTPGWYFLLKVYLAIDDPRYAPRNLDDWISFFTQSGVTIIDSRSKVISPNEMVQIITQRKFQRSNIPYGGDYLSWEEFHSDMKTEDGANDLIRYATTGCDGWCAHGADNLTYTMVSSDDFLKKNNAEMEILYLRHDSFLQWEELIERNSWNTKFECSYKVLQERYKRK